MRQNIIKTNKSVSTAWELGEIFKKKCIFYKIKNSNKCMFIYRIILNLHLNIQEIRQSKL